MYGLHKRDQPHFRSRQLLALDDGFRIEFDPADDLSLEVGRHYVEHTMLHLDERQQVPLADSLDRTRWALFATIFDAGARQDNNFRKWPKPLFRSRVLFNLLDGEQRLAMQGSLNVEGEYIGMRLDIHAHLGIGILNPFEFDFRPYSLWAAPSKGSLHAVQRAKHGDDVPALKFWVTA